MINLKNASIFGLFLAIFGMVMLVFRDSLFATNPVSISIQVIAGMLMLWARISFGMRSFHAAANPTAGGLVTSGPYKYLRHPIYAAIIYFLWAGISAHPQAVNFILGLLVSGGLFLRMLAEEKLVKEIYPEYEDYAAKTKRLIPFIF
jgi:protein-S-isoprenylcysteine O-methyltransferase Ste14